MILFTTTYRMSILLKQFGLTQKSSFYYHKKTKELYRTEEIPKIRDWEKLYISSYTDYELDLFLPDAGVSLTKYKDNWIAHYKTKEHDFYSGSMQLSANAKADLIIKLLNKRIIVL